MDMELHRDELQTILVRYDDTDRHAGVLNHLLYHCDHPFSCARLPDHPGSALAWAPRLIVYLFYRLYGVERRVNIPFDAKIIAIM